MIVCMCAYACIVTGESAFINSRGTLRRKKFRTKKGPELFRKVLERVYERALTVSLRV